MTRSGLAACWPKIGVSVIWPQKCELELSAKRNSWELVVQYYLLYIRVHTRTSTTHVFLFYVINDYRRSNQELFGRRARSTRSCATVRAAAGAGTEPASGYSGVRISTRGLLHAATVLSIQSKVHLLKRLVCLSRRARVRHRLRHRFRLRLVARECSPARGEGEQLRRARRAALRDARESHGGRRTRPSGLLVALATRGGLCADTCRVPPLAQDSLSAAHYRSQLVSFTYNN